MQAPALPFSTLLNRTTAFAARLCVLATRIGGIREVVEHGVTGMLVQPQDSHALAGGIEKLLTDPEQRQKLASNGFLRAQNEYSWERIAARFEDLYRVTAKKASKGIR
ncbi:MAG: glycosyltransferase family 4 protein [Deltaproteobacteria bacterium]|nr:glycosyltransferase family 4 protein [Deltaproteobacteria bacterium]